MQVEAFVRAVQEKGAIQHPLGWENPPTLEMAQRVVRERVGRPLREAFNGLELEVLIPLLMETAGQPVSYPFTNEQDQEDLWL